MTPRTHNAENELVRRWIETPTPRRSISRPAAFRASGADAVESFDWEDLVDRSERRRQALAVELGASFDGLPAAPAAAGGGRRAFHR